MADSAILTFADGLEMQSGTRDAITDIESLAEAFPVETPLMIALKKILCPTDFSEPSLAAANYALELARTFDAELHLLHVIEDPVLYSPAFGGYAPNPDDFEAYAKTGLENWISSKDAGDVPIARRWVHGRPFLGILQDAKQHDIDLIVIGTHGRGFLSHILLGSVAERVVREAPCPVLTVRPEGFRYEAIGAGTEGGGDEQR